jgi:hypothetical protein
MIENVCKKGERPPIPSDVPDTLKKLITSCWAPAPDERPTFGAVLPQFDKIILEYMIKDPIAQKFWEKNFAAEESISWLKFAKSYCQFFKIPMPEMKSVKFKCLYELIRDGKYQVMISHNNNNL